MPRVSPASVANVPHVHHLEGSFVSFDIIVRKEPVVMRDEMGLLEKKRNGLRVVIVS